MPKAFAYPAAWGELLVAIFALGALASLKFQWGLIAVWIFNIVGTLDFIYALGSAISTGAMNTAGGAVWLIPSVVVPAAIVVHYMIFRLLLTKNARRL